MGKKINDSSDKENSNEFDDTNNVFTMLQDAWGVGGLNFRSNEEVSNNVKESEEPNENAKKFFQLLEEY